MQEIFCKLQKKCKKILYAKSVEISGKNCIWSEKREKFHFKQVTLCYNDIIIEEGRDMTKKSKLSAKKVGWLFHISSLLIVCTDICVLFFGLTSASSIGSWTLLSIGIEFLGCIVMAVFIDGCYVDGGLSEESNYRSLAGLLMISFAFLTDTCHWLTMNSLSQNLRTLNFGLHSLSYLNDIALVYCFARYILSFLDRSTKVTRFFIRFLQSYYAFMAVMLTLNIPLRFLFDIDKNGNYEHKPLILYTVTLIIILVFLMFAYVAKLKFDFVEKRAILGYIGLPLFFTIVQEFAPAFSFKYCALFISACLVYVQSYVHKGRIMERNRLELQNQQTAIMLSQIQPHFLYNSLSAIAALCDIDPQLAKQTTLDFSTYLEHNLDAVTQMTPIPFAKEMEHVEAYLRIEKNRFGDLLHVEYDVAEQDFFLPALTVQPLVENAVKHGLHHKAGGGTVRIETHKTDNGWYIIVCDDGVGFDPSSPEIINHGVGIPNIRHRLKAQCDGALNFESEIGRGTTAIVFIPNRRKET